jgi:bud site selection protein 20
MRLRILNQKDPFDKHIKSKVHKRRLKELKVPKYTKKDAEAAIGLKTEDWKSKRVVDAMIAV